VKSRHVGVRVSPEEWATLAKAARDLGVPLSVFIRGCLGVGQRRKNGRPKSRPKRVENGP
jgi:hypothetical protein